MNRETHTIDATGRVLGRLATEIAVLLRGKNKPGFVLNIDMGDKVIVKNGDKIILTGKKESHKKYYRHSGFPGGIREISYKEMKETHPDRIIKLAVRGMLPDNRLRDEWMKRLTVEVSTDAK